MTVLRTNFILFVRDQRISTTFYETVLAVEPMTNVPGMTEFELGPGVVLGLMPEQSASRIVGEHVVIPEDRRAARSEVYLLVDEPEAFHSRALSSGGALLSEYAARSWGEGAVYCRDPDGHVLAFARRLESRDLTGEGSAG